MTDPDHRGFDPVDRAGRAAAASVLDAFDQAPAFEPADRRRGSLRPTILVAAAVVLALALGAAALALVDYGDDSLPVATEDGSPLQPLAPTYLPAGFELSAVVPPGHAVVPPGHDGLQRSTSFGLVRSDVDDPFEHELVHVQVVPADEPLQGVDGQRVRLGPDLEGIVWEVSGGQQVMWVEDGAMTTIATYDLGYEDLNDLARRISGRELGVAPEGWQSIPYSKAAEGRLHFADGDGGILSVGLGADLDLLSFLIAWERSECEKISSPCPEVTTTEVRGEQARLIEQVEPPPHLALAWTDRSGWAVALEGPLSHDELRRIAESLEPTTWDALSDQVVPRGSPPPDEPDDRDAPVPSPDDVAAVEQLVGSPDLQLRPVLDPAQLQGDAPEWTDEVAPIDGTSVRAAQPRWDQVGERWVVEIELDEEGTDALDSLAASCVERDSICPTGNIAIVWWGQVLAAPVFQEAGGFGGMITLTLDSFDILRAEP